ncbi:MAG: 50S ribosomal protein L16 [Candidatus Poseidoniia archaeon]|jgi:large subunit ribosomal protein L10e|uniref:Large ribosomal subunit protein uL16 n=1 Tax=Marine Group III euryarchaeote TaxID=2173149 RepID=A0A7C8DH30_9ARCH|nr:MAG: 50S ribosomal protein L16 [Euryarchaeota archaeon]HIG63890.1 50S ribosomal protein L16 [Marine Group III euryarchaeote]HIL33360.1 50S ribosomal protein L16 [Candidatus Poseidoniales archaeon]
MAKKNPAHMFRGKKPGYTRAKYIGGIPASRITQFDVGAPGAKFDPEVIVTLSADDKCLIRHNALEAARITANRHIMTAAGREGYHLKIRVYPHQVLRHNKVATGAGADRVSQGMRLSFGKPVGVAAKVRRGQKLITLRTSSEFADAAKEALRKSSHKLPTPCHIEVSGSN